MEARVPPGVEEPYCWRVLTSLRVAVLLINIFHVYTIPCQFACFGEIAEACTIHYVRNLTACTLPG